MSPRQATIKFSDRSDCDAISERAAMPRSGVFVAAYAWADSRIDSHEWQSVRDSEGRTPSRRGLRAIAHQIEITQPEHRDGKGRVFALLEIADGSLIHCEIDTRLSRLDPIERARRESVSFFGITLPRRKT